MSDELRYLRREVARLSSSLATAQARLAELGDVSKMSLARAQDEARHLLGNAAELEALRRAAWLSTRGSLQPHFDEGTQKHLFPGGWPDDIDARRAAYSHVGLTPDGAALSDDSEAPSEDLPNTFIHQLAAGGKR
jgi:hypothetical protein